MHPYYLANIAMYNIAERIPIYIEEVEFRHPELCLHSHTFTELVLVVSGHAVHILGNSKARVSRGDLLVIYPGMTHCYDETGDFSIINMVYDQKKLAMPMLDSCEMPHFLRLFPASANNITEEEACNPIGTVAGEHIAGLADQLRNLQLELKSTQPGSNFCCLGLFMVCIANLVRSVSMPSTGYKSNIISLENIIEHMHAGLAEPINIDELAKRARMSRRSFFRMFKNFTGTTPQEFQTRLRLKSAMELLTTTRLSIGEIACRCGFNDSNYFGQVFKKYCNATPRIFRAEHKVFVSSGK